MDAAPQEPSVDVGIPVTSRWQYVARAVESVLAQTFAHWQLVISQDGPANEQVVAAIEPYLGDARITYVTGTSMGAPGNKTRLVTSGSGTFVALLDDDDLWKPEFLAKQVSFLEEHDEAAFVFCANDVVDEQGRVIGRSRAPLPTGVFSPAEFMRVLVRHNVVSSPTVVVRRRAYESEGAGFDPHLPTTYDYDMWLRLAARHPVGYRASWDASYRHHAAQQTIVDRAQRGRELILLVDKIDALRLEDPALPIPVDQLRVKRARALLSHALDELEAGRPRIARQAALSAVRQSPGVVADRKLPLVVLGTLLGPLAPRVIRALRTFNQRRGITGGTLESARSVG